MDDALNEIIAVIESHLSLLAEYEEGIPVALPANISTILIRYNWHPCRGVALAPGGVRS